MKTNTPQQNISNGWRQTILSELVFIKKGEQLNKLAMDKSGQYPALNGGISPSGYTDKWNIEANTITISEGGNSCGFVNFNKERFWCGGHCYALINLEKNIDNNFLYQVLKFKQDDLMKLRVGSGLPNIQKRSIKEFPLLIPESEKEQQKIAEILGVVDEDIAKTQELIQSTEKLKRGFMQELFTIGDKKEIREIAELNPQQTNPLNEPSKDFYYIDIASIKENVITEVKKFFGKDAPSRARRVLNNKDIIISTVRPNLRGFTYISEEYDNYLGSTGFCVLRSNNNQVDSKFLYYIIANNKFTDYLVGKTTGSNYPAVNPTDIGEYICTVPSLDAQKEIADILSFIDEKILVNKKLKEKLILLKKGLMQDLLSGRVRTCIN